jgi:hypothetical protein
MIKDAIDFGKTAFGAFSPHRNPYYLLIAAGCAAIIISCLEFPTEHATWAALAFLAFFGIAAMIDAIRLAPHIEPKPVAHGRILCACAAILVFAAYETTAHTIKPEKIGFLDSRWPFSAFYAALGFSALQFIPFFVAPALARFRLTDLTLSVTACILAIGAEVWLLLAFPEFRVNRDGTIAISAASVALSVWGSMLILFAAMSRSRRATNGPPSRSI